ncbi:hypothetical protein METBIDRAFT_146331 [Metschnikowia bicuspidata var. bicuspidata NRRL YB-4993]|uniref:C2H2-type domain-containing protein n=1 Tax=Metschnikowia bicuspidata var. bicuspidata NRRL YB-4993 TaxID=869754 RepID=A0A1A0HDE1_9ASCO|nr:hypothetical protein METBIDRAFT_146331 [Metschnikowia bicuspidata var. bicuspidata NRRL YB-4993]OBA22099.1 hypothetical protein METBIDRAFT_146331 [Metschnikowia bicuspidata var. bicuspidata NRRL YB-4993]
MSETGQLQNQPTKHETGAIGATLSPASFPCHFCGRAFSRKGTYGRHLDSKKGDAQHPAGQVEALRSGVVRRAARRAGEPVADEKAGRAPKKVKRQKSQIAKVYNSKTAVKEKNRARRRARDLRLKAQLQAHEWYIGMLSGPQGLAQGPAGRAENASLEAGKQAHRSQGLESGPERSQKSGQKSDAEIYGARYAYAVASNVPPSQWPQKNGYPGDAEFGATVGQLTALAGMAPYNRSAPGPQYFQGLGPQSGGGAAAQDSTGAAALEQVFAWHAHWAQLGPSTKRALWQAECDRALRTHLHGASLCQISGAAAVVREKTRQLCEQYSQGAFLDSILTDSGPETP